MNAMMLQNLVLGIDMIDLKSGSQTTINSMNSPNLQVGSLANEVGAQITYGQTLTDQD